MPLPRSGASSAARSALGRPRREHRRLLTVKAAHSAVFVAELSAILWLVASGLLGRRDRSVAVAGVMVAAEAAVFVANRGVCPLTPLAERYGADDGRVSDIFLPEVVARTIPYWSTTLIAAAAVLHLRGMLRARVVVPRHASGDG